MRPTLAVPLATALLAPIPARADFFDGARRTFGSDIPHFFQDDIPCAFGGQPTSGAHAACKGKTSPPPRQPAPSARSREPARR